ncbi:MAG: fasciclin domain-containing protein [Reichenbachiella sp.]|uniref:fasciclin domain-containing protein n=1 Tax=Reichenbachiella sp. TaxID=2184521 RepID=UPI003267A952
MKSKHLLTILSVGIVLLLGGCSQGSQPESAASSEATPESHPKGQASVQDDVSAANILQVAAGSDAHTTLVAAVQAAEIEHVLVNAGPLTVFAPTNDAFAALPEGTVEDLLKPENKAKLANILTGHAAPGSYDLEALKKEARKGRKIYTATGQYLEVTVDGEEVSIAGAKILGTIQTSNGVINVVDKIILP